MVMVSETKRGLENEAAFALKAALLPSSNARLRK
jgi:hypothetical protein